MSKWHAHWDVLEKLLTEALESLRPQLSEKSADFVAEFINHNEFGVAFEALIEEIRMGDVEVDPATQSNLQKAGEMMDLPWR